MEDQKRPNLKLLDGGCAKPIDLEVERANRRDLSAQEITPETVLKLALADAKDPAVTKCYVTLVREDEGTFTTTNYRANLTRMEEVAFRQLGVQEQLDFWRNGE